MSEDELIKLAEKALFKKYPDADIPASGMSTVNRVSQMVYLRNSYRVIAKYNYGKNIFVD
jgi:hypothetical protein